MHYIPTEVDQVHNSKPNGLWCLRAHSFDYLIVIRYLDYNTYDNGTVEGTFN